MIHIVHSYRVLTGNIWLYAGNNWLQISGSQIISCLNKAWELFLYLRHAFLRLYLFVVILRGQEVIDDSHRLTQLLTQCIQKAVCVFWVWWFGEGVTPLVAAVGMGTRQIVSGLWRWWKGTVQADVGIGLPTGLACQPWWIELGWRRAGERLWPGCRW